MNSRSYLPSQLAISSSSSSSSLSSKTFALKTKITLKPSSTTITSFKRKSLYEGWDQELEVCSRTTQTLIS